MLVINLFFFLGRIESRKTHLSLKTLHCTEVLSNWLQVLPGLYVGNYRDSKDPVQLEKFKITHILSIHDAARRLHSVS